MRYPNAIKAKAILHQHAPQRFVPDVDSPIRCGGRSAGHPGTFIAGGILALLGVLIALPLLGSRFSIVSQSSDELRRIGQ